MRFRKQVRLLRLCLGNPGRLSSENFFPEKKNWRFFSSTKTTGNGYYLLLPSVPADNSETNPLLKTSEFPQFDKISEDQVLSGLGKITIDYESAFYRHEEEIEKSDKQTFSSVFDPLDRLNHSLVHAFTTAKTLSAVKKSPRLEDALLQSEQAVARCRSLTNSSQILLKSVKEISKTQTDLSEAQQRVLSKCLLEGRLNGNDLNPSDHRLYQSIMGTLREKQEVFRARLVTSSSEFSPSIMSPASMDETPANVRALFGNNPSDSSGSRSVTLKTPVYEAFMKYCRDSRLRWNAWQAYVGRAGFRDPNLNNSLIIEDIRQMRRREAKLFGYENYAALSMETKMARSVKNVMASVSEMTIPSKAKCQVELEGLQKFANQNGSVGDLQLWDMAYWRRRQREDAYKIEDAEVQPYFQFPKVLEELFGLCKEVFNVTIKHDKQTPPPVWHEDVQFYRIFDDDGKELAAFYLDPYARPEQKDTAARLELGQNKSDAAGSSPLASLIFSFVPPNSTSPSLLSYDDLNLLFQKFGTSLQHLLTTIPYNDVSGLNNVEWDALHVSGAVLRMFLQNPVILKRLSKHTQTGKEIPDDLIRRLHQSERHLSSLDLLSEMYFGVLDLSLYTKTDFWQDIMKDIWRDFMPFALDKSDAHPCGFAHIFIGHYAAGYYSFLWSEMVAADAYAAFTEAGFENQKEIKQIGKTFRDTFLSLGGGCHSAEVFRRFRGRDPSPQALLRLHEIV